MNEPEYANECFFRGLVRGIPRFKSFGQGKEKASCLITIHRRWKDRVYKTHNRIVAWGELARELAKASEEAEIAVKGRVETRRWEKDDGTTEWITEMTCTDVRIIQQGPGSMVTKESAVPPRDDDLPF